jgi:hypothetical protein
MPQAERHYTPITLVVDPGGPRERRVEARAYNCESRRTPRPDAASRKVGRIIQQHLDAAQNLIEWLDARDE